MLNGQKTHLKRLVGSVILGAVEGPELSHEEAQLFTEFKLSGVCLFKRNVAPLFSQNLRMLNQRLGEILTDEGARPLLSVDQEGGRVSRIPPPFPNLGPPLRLYSELEPLSALSHWQNYGFIVGSSLKALGFNTNFAPVVDIDTEPTNKAIGDRCFGQDPELVISRARAFMQGQTLAGIWGCLKHFPGQGDAKVDTHLGQAQINHDFEFLWERELKPYSELHQEADLVMVSHALYPKLDHRPASLSAKIMQDLLRNKVGFKGLVLSDDMNMKAIAQDDASWLEALRLSLEAGSDLLLICQGIERQTLACQTLLNWVEQDQAFRALLSSKAERIWAHRKSLHN